MRASWARGGAFGSSVVVWSGRIAGVSQLAAAQTGGAPGLVLLQRTVDAKYAPDSLQFPALLESPLNQSYVVKAGDSLEKIVSQTYSMGPKATPKLFDAVTARIVALNGIQNRDALQAGAKLALPDLPPFQWKKPNPTNPNYGIPRVQGGPSYKAVHKARPQVCAVLQNLAKSSMNVGAPSRW